MKKVVLLFALAVMTLMSSSKVSAQGKYGPDSTECIKYLSYYTEYYKQKNYDAALPNWRKAYKYCPPTSRYSLLSDGTTLVRRLIIIYTGTVCTSSEIISDIVSVWSDLKSGSERM